jgi:CO/xanthine dehydrogenase Mo-binding subunit
MSPGPLRKSRCRRSPKPTLSLNPLRVKGVGETDPAIAAIVGAVDDALRLCVWIAEVPLTPHRIVALLGEAALGRRRYFD